jgi:hypothetical protein
MQTGREGDVAHYECIRSAVVCSENRQRAAGTRRVRQPERVRSPAGTGDTPECSICRTNVIADDWACTPLPRQNFHGKEGVDGSSPSEGSAKAQQMGLSRGATPLNSGEILSPRPLPSVAGGGRSWREQGSTAARSTSITRRGWPVRLSGSGSEIGFEIGPQRWRERWPICAVVIAARHPAAGNPRARRVGSLPSRQRSSE